MDVLWRQWRAVGGQAATKRSAQAIVDPEALVLLSLALENHEHRLGDILHDWTALNSDLLSVQRAKNLAADYPEATHERLARLARVALIEGKDLRWRSLAGGASGSGSARAQPESSRTNKARAIRARLTEPATLLLRLRLGFGVGAKADVLGFLLGNGGEWATVREIATATAYTVAAVRRAAEDMAAARLIQVSAGSPTAFRADRAGWANALGLESEPIRWPSWRERFAFVAAFLAWVEGTSARPISAYAAAVKAREILESHQAAFELDLITVWSQHTPVIDWMAFVEGAVRSLAQWMVKEA